MTVKRTSQCLLSCISGIYILFRLKIVILRRILFIYRHWCTIYMSVIFRKLLVTTGNFSADTMLSVTSIYLMCFLAWVVFGLVCLQQFRSGYSSVGCFLAASWKCRLLRSHYTCVVYNRGIHCEAIWLSTVTVTVYKPAATLNCFKTAWNQWNKCCYVCFWAICWREMYNWLTSGTLEKNSGFWVGTI